eukprot:jgi/Tetstr1/423855/TSEL_014479.t1
MVGCYGKFIAQVAVKRKPLTKLTSKGNPDWSRFIMHTDFSGAGLGAVLAHEDEGREYVVEFASRTCQGMEPNYASYEGECLAMLYGTSKFRYCLFGRQFVVVTYHWPLEWLKNTAQLRGKLARWAMRLSEYDFVVRYRKSVNADCLSQGAVEGDPTVLDGRGEFSPEGAVRLAGAFCCAAAESSRQPKLSAWARRCVLDAAHEGAANGDLVAVTSELSAGPQRGDTWMGTEAMAELQAGNVNIRSFTSSKILNKLKSCITWTKKSSKSWHALVLACREMRVKDVKFITPVKTRFTSTWSMLRSFITARVVVDHLYGTMPQTASTNLRERQPTHVEWSVAAAMEDVLSHPCKLGIGIGMYVACDLC